MKRKNILRAKKYMNNFSKGKTFEKRIRWIMTHVSIHLMGIWEGEEYDIWGSNSLPMSLRPKRDTRLSPHLHWAIDECPWEPSVIIYQCIDDEVNETEFIDEQIFLTHRSDTGRINDAWVRTFWLR